VALDIFRRDALSGSDLPYRLDFVDLTSIDEGFRRIVEFQRIVVQSGSSQL
jgi:hypothetical protein